MEDPINEVEEVKINWRRLKSRKYYLTAMLFVANLSMISHGQAAGMSSFDTPDFWDTATDDGWGVDGSSTDFNKWFSMVSTLITLKKVNIKIPNYSILSFAANTLFLTSSVGSIFISGLSYMIGRKWSILSCNLIMLTGKLCF